jgi:hypothetical protein
VLLLADRPEEVWELVTRYSLEESREPALV